VTLAKMDTLSKSIGGVYTSLDYYYHNWI